MKAFQKVVFLALVWQCEFGTSFLLRHNSSRDSPNSEDCEANLCVGSHCDLDACDACDSCKIIEVQRVTVSGRRWESVTFADPFQVVPVVVMLPSTNGHHPATIRIKDVTKTGFKAVITEPPKQDGPHGKMQISYMAAIPGTHKLGGKAFNVRVHETSSTVGSRRGKCKSPGPAETWDDVAFQSVFAEPPAFVAAVQTMNNEKNRVPTKTSAPFLTVAAKELTKDGVKLALELSETGKKGGEPRKSEQIGLIVMEAATGDFKAKGADIKYAALLSGRSVKGWGPKNKKPKATSVPFGIDLGEKPLIVGMQVTRGGHGGGWMRMKSAHAQKVKVTIDEDKSCDRERNHQKEEVSVMAFSAPFSKR